MELQLSACREEAGGAWRLAPVARFADECGLAQAEQVVV